MKSPRETLSSAPENLSKWRCNTLSDQEPKAKELEYWREQRHEWHVAQGLRREKLRFHQHRADELAHYADGAFDIEYQFPIGWQEVEGIHSRTDFDLKQHQLYSKKNLHYVDQADGNKKYLPYVVETSVGLDRHLLSLLCDAFRVDNLGTKEERTVLKLSPQMSPIKVAVMPLMKKPALEQLATQLRDDVQTHYKTEYDTAGSIGKRYRRQDEIGTPILPHSGLPKPRGSQRNHQRARHHGPNQGGLRPTPRLLKAK